jgi:serine/threonine-protein kinase
MGRVYQGQAADGKRVAIKVLHPDVAQDMVAVERFKRESDTARELAHPHVVSVYDFAETPDGSYYMAMEYLDGEELSQALRREGTLSAPRVVRIVGQLAEALDHAHSFGVIHRDLKPDNVFLVKSPDGDVVKILDYGSVKLQMETGPKLTAFGTTLGSPYYMSPEQAMGKSDVDQRTDVFAIAAILFEMLTGKIAFEGANVAQILMRIMNEQPPGPSTMNGSVPAAVDDVVEKGLRKDKARRYASVSDLANALVTAYGLPGSAKEWAHKPIGEIAGGLNQATPAAPKPFGAASIPPPSAHAPARPAAGPPAAQPIVAARGEGLPARSGGVSPVMIGAILVGGLVLLGGCALMWMFMHG